MCTIFARKENSSDNKAREKMIWSKNSSKTTTNKEELFKVEKMYGNKKAKANGRAGCVCFINNVGKHTRCIHSA
jgi:hypothetical protein